MTERKPRGVSFESWVEKQIREAAERGEFDNLPGAGQPLPGFGGTDDENWWLRSYVRREGVPGEAFLPTALQLRKEVEELGDRVRDVPSEEEVRAVVAKLNQRIMDCWRSASGPQIPVRAVNAETVVERWRADRSAVGEAPGTAGAGEPVGAARPANPHGCVSSAVTYDQAANWWTRWWLRARWKRK